MNGDRAVLTGAAIEGAKVSGSSRDPLRNFGICVRNGIRCYRFVATFDVRAGISQTLQDGVPMIEPCANRQADAAVQCSRATIHSLDDKPKVHVAERTGAHRASHWRFADQTGVRVDAPHENLVNSMAKSQKRLGEAG